MSATPLSRAPLAALLVAYTRVSWSLLVLLVMVPAYTMAARLYEGAHHLSDVLVSFAYALAWLTLCARLLLPRRDVDATRAA